jgi:hypothetical protein
MPRSLRITLGADTRGFEPEVSHVLGALRVAHGIEWRDCPAGDARGDAWLHYGCDPPAGAIHMPAILFPAAARIEDDGIHLDRARLDTVARGLLPTADPRAFDAIGLCFLLMTRLEERDHAGGDRYGRYPFEADFMRVNGLYGGVPVDEALLALARLATGEDEPASATRYRVVATHDVDRLRAYHRPTEPLRLAAGDILRRRDPMRALERLAAYGSREPWPSVRDIMEMSERHGIRSRFFFMGPSEDSHDSPYGLTMAGLLRRVAGEILARGHAVGFHPGFGSATDAALWDRQRRGLEQVLGQTVREGRQHMLLWRADATPDIWHDAGMSLDLTLAYPEAEGFRTGSCRALPAYSLRRRKTLSHLQASTPVMEFGQFGGKYRDRDVDDALQGSRGVIASCRRHGGDLVMLFHTGQRHGPARAFHEAMLAEACGR